MKADLVGKRIVLVDENDSVTNVRLEDGTLLTGELFGVAPPDPESAMYRHAQIIKIEARSLANTLSEAHLAVVDGRFHRDELAANLVKAARWIRFFNGDGV